MKELYARMGLIEGVNLFIFADELDGSLDAQKVQRLATFVRQFRA